MTFKILIMETNILLKIAGKRRLGDPFADFLTAGGERRDIVGGKLFQLGFYLLIEAVGGQEFPERIGGGGKASGDADPGSRKRAAHLAQRGILAADLRQIAKAQILEPGYAHSPSILSACSAAPFSSSPMAPASPRRCSAIAC